MTRLEDVLDRYGAGIARVAAGYERDPALREDLVQDIALAIHLALPRLREPDRLAAFTFRIAHNRAVAHVMRRMAAKRPVEDPEVDAPATPEDELLGAERAATLARAVRRLPLPYRQVVMLHLEDLSHAEIADALGLAPGAVAVRLHRAKALLKEMLDP